MIDFSWMVICCFFDIVLFVCIQWECNDIDFYGFYFGKGLIVMYCLVDLLFQLCIDFEIMIELICCFGCEKEYICGMDEMEWVCLLYDECKKVNEGKFVMLEFEEFWEKGFFDFGIGIFWVCYVDFCKDFEINVLGMFFGFIEIMLCKIGCYGYEYC